MNSYFPAIGPMSTALIRSTTPAATGDKPAPPAKGGAFSRGGDKEKQKELAQLKSQQRSSPASGGVVDEFFWIGSSIVAFSKWRLGYMGELLVRGRQPLDVCWSQLALIQLHCQ